MYHHCVPYKDDQYSGWCYTRLHQNDSGVRTKSGNCDPSCYDHWNKMGKTNYNLASKDHNDLWSENIFLIDSENAGHCHTYNPVNRSHAGSSGQFYSMLGRFSSILFAICIWPTWTCYLILFRKSKSKIFWWSYKRIWGISPWKRSVLARNRDGEDWADQ